MGPPARGLARAKGAHFLVGVATATVVDTSGNWLQPSGAIIRSSEATDALESDYAW